MQHNSHNWKINKEGTDFIYTKERTKGSLVRHLMFKYWIKQSTKEELRLVIDWITIFLGGANRTIFYILSTGIFKNLRVIKHYFTKEQLEKVKHCKNILLTSRKQAKKEVKRRCKEARKNKASVNE